MTRVDFSSSPVPASSNNKSQGAAKSSLQVIPLFPPAFFFRRSAAFVTGQRDPALSDFVTLKDAALAK